MPQRRETVEFNLTFGEQTDRTLGVLVFSVCYTWSFHPTSSCVRSPVLSVTMFKGSILGHCSRSQKDPGSSWKALEFIPIRLLL